MKLKNNCRNVAISIADSFGRHWAWLLVSGTLMVGVSHHDAQSSARVQHYHVVNPDKHAGVDFVSDTVRVRSERTATGASNSATDIGVHLARFGREGAMRRVPVASEPVRKGNRVEYRREGNVTEWYVNGPLALEQGFTLGGRPEGTGHLVLELALSDGLEPRLSSDGSVDLYNSSRGDGATVEVGRYSGLRVEDARGNALDARLAVVDGTIAITVDDSAATYPIVVDPTLTLQHRFDFPNAPSGGQFGSAVAIDGDSAAIGAFSFANSTGAVYTYQRSGTVWSMQQTLLGASGDQFGLSLALSGNTLFVGAPKNNRTYVFTRTSTGSQWSQLQLLGPALPLNGDYFGFGIAFAGNTVLIGDCSRNGSRGAAYVFVNPSGTVWQQQAELTANDAQANDIFGCDSVALTADGNTALVGAFGSGSPPARTGAYFFSRSGTTWSQSQRVSVGVPSDGFGNSVAVAGLTAFIGAPFKNGNSGSVYPFVLSASTWFQLPEIAGGTGDQFGTSLWFDGTTALIGAPGNRAVYQVAENGPGAGWSVQQRLSESSAPGFGQSVALSSSTTFTALVGAALNGVPSDPGAAYAFASGQNQVPALGEAKAPLLALVLGLGGVGVLVQGRRRRTRECGPFRSN